MKVQFTTSIDLSILDTIREIAKKEKRSLNNAVEYLLEYAVEVYEKEHGL